MTKPQIEAVFKRFEAWLNEDETWEEDLDGYSGIDLATAAASKFKSMLVEECEPK